MGIIQSLISEKAPVDMGIIQNQLSEKTLADMGIIQSLISEKALADMGIIQNQISEKALADMGIVQDLKSEEATADMGINQGLMFLAAIVNTLRPIIESVTAGQPPAGQAGMTSISMACLTMNLATITTTIIMMKLE